MKTADSSAPAEKSPEKSASIFSRRAAIRVALCACAAPAFAFGSRWSALAAALPLPPRPQAAIPAANILEPAQLAALLSASGEKPVVICVGFKFLYDTAHIASSLFLGPAREADGLAALEKWAGAASRGRMVALYCGCCPWDKCPNIRPAYAAMAKQGFSRLRVVRIDQDFATDWDQRGFPTTRK